jgi:hypothetical protein
VGAGFELVSEDWSMNQATDNGSWQTIGSALGSGAAILFLAAAIIHPKVADAAHDGRGIHGGGGGFHARGPHPGSRHFHSGFVGIYAPYWWGYGYPYYNYGYYGDNADRRYYGYDPGASYYGNYPDYGYGSHPNARQTWYYCSDPAGYHPYVTQCKIGWQSVPAS